MVGTIALAVLRLVAFARENPEQPQCPANDRDGIVNLIRQTPSCARAIALFQTCQFGSSGDVALGAAVTAKCEDDFLNKLGAAQKAEYERRQKQCAHKYQKKAGTMYRSFAAFCAAYVARDYSAKFFGVHPNSQKK